MFTQGEVKVKVTKFFIGRKELINVYKLTKFDLCIMNGFWECIINGSWETKLNATAKRKLLTPDRQTDGFGQFIDWTFFGIGSIKSATVYKGNYIITDMCRCYLHIINWHNWIVTKLHKMLKAGPLRLKQLTNTLKIRILSETSILYLIRLRFNHSNCGSPPVKTYANKQSLLGEK